MHKMPQRKSPRWQAWDYAKPGAYFITIVTKDRKHLFGRIELGEMILNKTGLIAYNCWKELPDHFYNVELGEFQVMPDHFHGIIFIKKEDVIVFNVRPETSYTELSPGQKRIRNQGKNTVSAMVGSFKSAVTRLARPFNKEFGWQVRFHDHVIRTPEALDRISKYIKNNPANWNPIAPIDSDPDLI